MTRHYSSPWRIVTALAAAFCIFPNAMLFFATAGQNDFSRADSVPVHTAVIQRTTLRGYINVSGTIKPEAAGTKRPSAQCRLSPPIGGVIFKAICAEGQEVEAGDILFHLDNRLTDALVVNAEKRVGFTEKLYLRQQERTRLEDVISGLSQEKAEEASRLAEQEFDRQKKLLAVDGTSQRNYAESQYRLMGARKDLEVIRDQRLLVKISKELSEAEQKLFEARNNLSELQTRRSLLEVRAPVKGTVLRIFRNPGESVERGTVLALIIDLDRLIVEAGVPSTDLFRLRLGESVRIDTSAGPSDRDSTYQAGLTSSLTFIDSQVDIQNDTVIIRAPLPAGHGLRPGQFVHLVIEYEQHENCLTVPAESVETDAGNLAKITLVENGIAVKRKVSLGLREGNLIEISGNAVQEGQIVVTTEAYGLPDGTIVHITNVAETAGDN